MRRSLAWKMVLAFMLVALLTAGLLVLFIRIRSVEHLSSLIVDQKTLELQKNLETYYSLHGSWEGLEEDWSQVYPGAPFVIPFAGGGAPPPNAGANFPPPQEGENSDPPRMFILADASGDVVVPAEPGFPVKMPLPAEEIASGTPVEVNGQRVGTIVFLRRPPHFTAAENRYLQRFNTALLYATGLALLAALGLGMWMARRMLRPLRHLTEAAQNIARGNYGTTVNVRSDDEIAHLAESFNAMSQEVARANQLRRQMTADIAHDLRTPLTVIGGYIESMRDGVLEASPERLHLIYTEIERLQNLVGDLRMLSLADAGELTLNPQRMTPAYLLERACAPYRELAEQNKVKLRVAAADNLPEVMVDEARMMQVFDNLISNALRYTPAGGEITLSAMEEGEAVLLCVEDTGCGIPPEDLPHLFERFYRGDRSRHAEDGETGLGLSIARALVEAHGGSIRAESAQGKGTRMVITLPRG
ncbi:MAG: HAMP domain-containing histidine kinase [Anaerolineae bacterium]|nr:HAMP domain-containing histidine kinase [Anaerolineae bacterium]